MIEKHEIFTLEFLEIIDKLKGFVEKYISMTQAEESQQAGETVDISTTDSKEETMVKPSEEKVENPEIKIVAANVTKIHSQIQDFAYKDKIINDLHKELQQYKNGLKESFNKPLLKEIAHEYDRANKQYRFYLEKSQEESQSELFNKLLYEFDILSIALLNLLSNNDIEPYNFNIGDTHDIELQKIVEVIETEDPQKDGTVAECVVCGFRNIETSRIFRKSEVKIFKLKK